jgi:lipid A ethanolaminephosphotransferase
MSHGRTFLAQAGLLPPAKLVLLALYLLCDYQAFSGRIASLGPSFELAAFAVLYGALALALGAAAFIASPLARLTLGACLAAGSLALHSYEWSTGAPLVYEAFETMVASRGHAGEAASQHGGVLLRAIGAALLLFGALALPPGRWAVRFAWTAPTVAVLALAGLLYVRGGEGARALPAPFAPLAQGVIMGTLAVTREDRPRERVNWAPAPALIRGDLVLVIDESVAANYLDINHPLGVRSGLATPPAALSISNFGVAASAANCSTGSNLTLRYGGTRETYRTAFREKPSLWAYAHQTGLRTVYLDGQRRGGALQNLMTPAERTEIDDFVQLGETPVPQRDHELARLLAERLRNGVRELIVVNKVGAHFPVADKFPSEAAHYHPLPPRGLTEGIIDIASLPGTQPPSSDEWRLYRNAYRNTVMWNTGGFFDRVLPAIEGQGAVIVYTADHGQDLHERGGIGGSTHCVAEPMPEEGAVPLVLIVDRAANPALGKALRQAADTNHDRMSHFRLFPTLLALMGYARQQTAAFYGPTLLEPAHEPLSFTPTYNATLGREPTWHRIEPADLETPPPSDLAQVADAR